jgi:hypothetical protein
MDRPGHDAIPPATTAARTARSGCPPRPTTGTTIREATAPAPAWHSTLVVRSLMPIRSRASSGSSRRPGSPRRGPGRRLRHRSRPVPFAQHPGDGRGGHPGHDLGSREHRPRGDRGGRSGQDGSRPTGRRRCGVTTATRHHGTATARCRARPSLLPTTVPRETAVSQPTAGVALRRRSGGGAL